MDDQISIFQHWLKARGIRPEPAKGQHFLCDPSVLDEMVDVADLASADRVLEIGPGFGLLTERLAPKVAKVISVELDQQFRPALDVLASRFPNLRVLWMDVLKMNISAVMGREPYAIVANLPYLISSRIFKLFLGSESKPVAMTVLVQKEVGERICAQPGDHSLLSLSVQFYGEPFCDAIVPRTAFYPQPKVDSIILRIDHIGGHHPDIEDPEEFFRLLRIGFSSKRKQLQNNLANGLHRSRSDLLNCFERLGLGPTVRAQELSLNQWKRLFHLLQA